MRPVGWRIDLATNEAGQITGTRDYQYQALQPLAVNYDAMAAAAVAAPTLSQAEFRARIQRMTISQLNQLLVRANLASPVVRQPKNVYIQIAYLNYGRLAPYL